MQVAAVAQAAIGAAVRKGLRGLTLRLAALLFGLAGLGLLLAAALLGLARLVGPVLAPAIAGAALLLVAVLLWLVARSSGKPPPQAVPDPARTLQPTDAAFVIGLVAGRVLLRWLSRSPRG